MKDETKVGVAADTSTMGKKAVKAKERRFADAFTPDEDIIEWDAKGDQVFFADDMRTLSGAVLEKLSKLTVIKYQQALDIKRRLDGDDPEWSKINKSLKISQSGYASPFDIAFGNKARAGMQTRLVREDRVGYWEGKGYVMAAPEHMVDAKMRNVEGHYEHGTIGAPKEYLMVTTDENKKRLTRINDERRQAIDTSQVEDLRRKATDAGLKLTKED